MQNHSVGFLARARNGTSSSNDRPGTPLVSAVIARGGMGFVELCGRKRGPFIRWFARKRMHPEWRIEPEFRRMFYDEARLAHLIRHRNIVRVQQAGEDADGPFLIMDYVEGVPLWTVLRRLTKSGEFLPVQLAVCICRQIALGLHAAHEVRTPDGSLLELVHRDVSPNNILVGFDGSVRLADFGIAKARDNVGHTSIGIVKGTPGYVSPEQLLFQDVDRRSDLFALGIVIYELLSSTRLYGGRRENARDRVLSELPPDIVRLRPEVPGELAELVRELLAKSPHLRPRTADEVASRLNQILRGLVEAQGPQSLADYINIHFRHTRERLQSLAADQRSRLKGDTPIIERVQEEVVTSVETPRRERPPSRPRQRNWLLWCGTLVLFALAIGTAHPWMSRATPAGWVLWRSHTRHSHPTSSRCQLLPHPLPATNTGGRPAGIATEREPSTRDRLPRGRPPEPVEMLTSR